MVPAEPLARSGRVKTVSGEVIIAEAVRQWVGQVLPDEPGVADAAAGVATHAYEGGASVGEACREARRYVGSWCRHPSHRRPGPGLSLGLAS
jgi:hypothetical protein